MICVVVVANPMWPEVLPAEVDEFSSNLDCGQIEEVPNAFDLDVGQSPVQPDHRILKDIVRLFPSPEARTAMKHATGKEKESITGMVEQMLLRSCVTL